MELVIGVSCVGEANAHPLRLGWVPPAELHSQEWLWNELPLEGLRLSSVDMWRNLLSFALSIGQESPVIAAMDQATATITYHCCGRIESLDN